MEQVKSTKLALVSGTPRSYSRMVFVLFAIFGLVAAGAMFLWTSARDNYGIAGPHVACREPIWELGRLEKTAPVLVKHSFWLENKSSDLVNIKEVVADCGCVVAEELPRDIAPKSKCELKLRINLGGRPGPFQKRVDVILGTSPMSRVTLLVQGVFAPTPLMYSAPGQLDFGTLTQNDIRSRKVRIARWDESAVSFSTATAGSGALQFKAPVLGDSVGSFIELDAVLDASRLELGRFSSILVVATKNAAYSTIEIPVVANVISRTPGVVTSLFVDRLARGEYCDRSLLDGTQPTLRIEAVRYVGDGPITVKFIPIEQSRDGVRLGTVRVLRTQDWVAAPRICHGELIVKLSELSNEVRIPLDVLLAD